VYAPDAGAIQQRCGRTNRGSHEENFCSVSCSCISHNLSLAEKMAFSIRTLRFSKTSTLLRKFQL
jgi:hypothetical protein